VITCHLRYEIHPAKLAQFEVYAELWIHLVDRFGGRHHGYFLPSEGASNIALALFTFPSLAEYERYRSAAAEDPECQEALRFAEDTGCILKYERSFFRPLLPPVSNDELHDHD